MRKVVLKMHMSVDGFVGTPDGDVGWIFGTFDDEMAEWEVSLRKAGTHVMGRVLYGDMAAHWPHSDEPYAAPMNETPKVVFSSTLTETPWGETRIARGDVAEEVARLREEPGGPVLAHGGSRFAQSLSAARLVDEYQLVVHPQARGEGLPIFGAPLGLRLREARAFPAGAVLLSYERA
jgi:dihydrofolate reductase